MKKWTTEDLEALAEYVGGYVMPGHSNAKLTEQNFETIATDVFDKVQAFCSERGLGAPGIIFEADKATNNLEINFDFTGKEKS